MTELDVTFTSQQAKRGFHQRELPHYELLDRGKGNEHQHALWQSHFGAYDYHAWATEHNLWVINPYSGKAYLDACECNQGKKLVPYIRSPDASYWAAMGMLNNKQDLTCRTQRMGCWVNELERVHACSDATMFTSTHARLKAVRLDEKTSTHRDARKLPGRSTSHTPYRRRS